MLGCYCTYQVSCQLVKAEGGGGGVPIDPLSGMPSSCNLFFFMPSRFNLKKKERRSSRHFLVLYIRVTYIWGLISGELITGEFISGGFITGGLYPRLLSGAYIRGLITGGLKSGSLSVRGAYNRGTYIQKPYNRGLISGAFIRG